MINEQINVTGTKEPLFRMPLRKVCYTRVAFCMPLHFNNSEINAREREKTNVYRFVDFLLTRAKVHLAGTENAHRDVSVLLSAHAAREVCRAP